MALSYQQPGLTLARGISSTYVRDLQRDLRSLGYLRRGIDGSFGPGTESAVKALQHDLLFNHGEGSDGLAPVAVTWYNRGRVGGVTGVVDQSLVACIADMLADPAYPKLPSAVDPRAENQKIAIQIAALPPTSAPTPFLVAVLKRESNLQHFAVPTTTVDADSFVVVGTDTNNTATPYAITSRGYGAGQFTLFHHPPRPEEVEQVILDPGKNVEAAAREMRVKMDNFVAGPVSKADDRIAEHGPGPVRLCKYAPGDARYMTDCKACIRAAGTRDIAPGLPVFTGSTLKWSTTQYYPTATYLAVPKRENVGCDWPYAIRRYNGSGINSYHYQALVLKNVAAQ
jgi:peptidoglycan hydrolase-like protein with peptidoglycan-binding domain